MRGKGPGDQRGVLAEGKKKEKKGGGTSAAKPAAEKKPLECEVYVCRRTGGGPAYRRCEEKKKGGYFQKNRHDRAAPQGGEGHARTTSKREEKIAM